MKKYLMIIVSLFFIVGCSQTSEPVVEKNLQVTTKPFVKKEVKVLTNTNAPLKKKLLPDHIRNSHIKSVERY